MSYWKQWLRRKQSVVRSFCACFVLLSVAQLHFATNFHRDLQIRDASNSLRDAVVVHQDFPSGVLNVQPTYHKQCATVRFRGDSHNYTVDQAIDVLRLKYEVSPGPRALKMGIEYMETPQIFFPVRIGETAKTYHMFHFVELLVIAYAELHRLAGALPQQDTPLQHDGTATTRTTTLGRGSPAMSVPWILSPHMAPSEICGPPTGINCLIADLVLRASNSSIFQNNSGIVGLNAMEAFDYATPQERKKKAVDQRMELASQVYSSKAHESHAFGAQTDAVLLVERFGCNNHGINKPWSGYIGDFPANNWHADVMHGLGLSQQQGQAKKKIVVGYIDRQNTKRRLPSDHHEWLVGHLSNHTKIEFKHLHMETYPAIEQIRIASQIDVLVGVHGNGMTHSLWMRPESRVIELFWLYAFQFDYATAAQLQRHIYLGILNGKVIDKDMIARRDAALRKDKEAQVKANQTEADNDFAREGKAAIKAFLEEAIQKLL